MRRCSIAISLLIIISLLLTALASSQNLSLNETLLNQTNRNLSRNISEKIVSTNETLGEANETLPILGNVTEANQTKARVNATMPAFPQVNFRYRRIIEVGEDDRIREVEEVTVLNTGNSPVTGRWWTFPGNVIEIKARDAAGTLTADQRKNPDGTIDYILHFRRAVRPGEKYTYTLEIVKEGAIRSSGEEKTLVDWVVTMYPWPTYNVTTEVLLPEDSKLLSFSTNPIALTPEIAERDGRPVLIFKASAVPPSTPIQLVVTYRVERTRREIYIGLLVFLAIAGIFVASRRIEGISGFLSRIEGLLEEIEEEEETVREKRRRSEEEERLEEEKEVEKAAEIRREKEGIEEEVKREIGEAEEKAIWIEERLSKIIAIEEALENLEKRKESGEILEDVYRELRDDYLEKMEALREEIESKIREVEVEPRSLERDLLRTKLRIETLERALGKLDESFSRGEIGRIAYQRARRDLEEELKTERKKLEELEKLEERIKELRSMLDRIERLRRRYEEKMKEIEERVEEELLEERLRILEAQRSSILATIKKLEKEKEEGKIDQEIYEELRKDYEEELARIDREIEELRESSKRTEDRAS